MTSTLSKPERRAQQADHELPQKNILLALTGLAVLVGPVFMAALADGP